MKTIKSEDDLIKATEMNGYPRSYKDILFYTSSFEILVGKKCKGYPILATMHKGNTKSEIETVLTKCQELLKTKKLSESIKRELNTIGYFGILASNLEPKKFPDLQSIQSYEKKLQKHIKASSELLETLDKINKDNIILGMDSTNNKTYQDLGADFNLIALSHNASIEQLKLVLHDKAVFLKNKPMLQYFAKFTGKPNIRKRFAYVVMMLVRFWELHLKQEKITRRKGFLRPEHPIINFIQDYLKLYMHYTPKKDVLVGIVEFSHSMKWFDFHKMDNDYFWSFLDSIFNLKSSNLDLSHLRNTQSH